MTVINPTDEFLRYAADCERMAKVTRDPASKATWKRMADRWLPHGSLSQLECGRVLHPQDLQFGRLELLRELAPKASTVAVLVNKDSPASLLEGTNAQTAAQAFGVQTQILNASNGEHIDDALTTITTNRIARSRTSQRKIPAEAGLRAAGGGTG